MKGTLQPHPPLLAFTNTNDAHTVTVVKATAPILEGPKRESSRRRRELSGLRVLFGEYAMKGTLQPYPTLLAFTNTDYTYRATVVKATAPILDGPEAYSPIRGAHFAGCAWLKKNFFLKSPICKIR